MGSEGCADRATVARVYAGARAVRLRPEGPAPLPDALARYPMGSAHGRGSEVGAWAPCLTMTSARRRGWDIIGARARFPLVNVAEGLVPTDYPASRKCLKGVPCVSPGQRVFRVAGARGEPTRGGPPPPHPPPHTCLASPSAFSSQQARRRSIMPLMTLRRLSSDGFWMIYTFAAIGALVLLAIGVLLLIGSMSTPNCGSAVSGC